MAPNLREVTDRQEWDEIVKSRPVYAVTHSWAWGELKGAFGWKCWRYVFPADGPPRAAAQILGKPVKPLRTEIWYAPRGLLVDYGDDRTLKEMTAALRDLASGSRAAFLKIEPLVRGGGDLNILRELGYVKTSRHVQPTATIFIDLRRSEEELLVAMERRTRYNVNLATRKGVIVRASSNPPDVKAFYALLNATTARKHFAVHDENYYFKMLTAFGEDATLLFAQHEGDTLAAALVLTFGDFAYYVAAASSAIKRELKASNKLVWEAIRWAKSRNCAWFDFWGIPPKPSPANPLWGVYNFKKGFGGEEVHFVGAYDLPFRRVTHKFLDGALALYGAWRNLRARGTWRDPMAS